MTRKKFVKQLMALGYPRNNAEALAIYARCGGWTYEQYLKVEREYNGQLTALENAARTMANRFADGMRQLAPAVQKIADKVKEAFKEINFVLPLTTSNRDGYVAAWSAVDEVHQWPKENPHLGGGGHD